jgi:hypothetical protein
MTGAVPVGYLLAMSVLTPLGRAASAAGGVALGLAARATGAARAAAKPLHPTGRLLTGRLHRHGLDEGTGVRLLDEPGDEEVVVRESRSVGLPGWLPDIQGLAIRVTNPDGSPGDLLLASTGWGRLTRFVLTPSLTTYGRPMTTLLPYRTPQGPLLLGARSDQPGVVRLACALGSGPWRFFAELTISDQSAEDPTVSFDPVLHPVPGLDQYPAVVRLREPAYHFARRSREA